MTRDDEVRDVLRAIGAAPTRQSAQKSFRKGSDEFDRLMDQLEREWDVDTDTLEDIVELRRAGDSFEFRLKGESEFELLEDDGEGDDSEEEE